MKDQELGALIKGGIRTVAQLAPGIGSAFAQAWTEYESFTQNKRVTEFFQQFGKRIAKMEMQHIDLVDRVSQLEDRSELLEDIVSRVRREPDGEKREYYVNMLAYFASEPLATTGDERQSLIEDLDSLTLKDFSYLWKLSGGPLRGDMITGTTFTEIAVSDVNAEEEWDRVLAPAINSLAKLESRGLIVPTSINATFGYSGLGNTWYNQFRAKAWRNSSLGTKLLKAIDV